MADLDFPPNPEDGELWLPSDIIHEITSANVASPNNTTTLLPHQPSTTTTTTATPAVAPNLEIRFGSFVTKPNADGSSSLSLYCGPDELVPAPISIYNPTTATKSLKGFEEHRSMVYVEKYGGTGVFLPRSVKATAPKKAEKDKNGGTGTAVFINPHQKKKKKSGKNEGSLETSNQKIKSTTKKEALEKKEESQHPYEICLPKDWTY